MKVNEVRQLSKGKNPVYEIVIWELCCYLHPDGRTIKKDLTEFHTLRSGYVPKSGKKQEQMIAKRKREQEAYELEGGAKRVWWELPPSLEEQADD